MAEETTQEELAEKHKALLRKQTEESIKGCPTERKRRAKTRAKKGRKTIVKKGEGSIETTPLTAARIEGLSGRSKGLTPPKDLPVVDIVGGSREMAQDPGKAVDRKRKIE